MEETKEIQNKYKQYGTKTKKVKNYFDMNTENSLFRRCGGSEKSRW